MLLLACCRFPTSSLNVHYDEKRSWICCFGPGSARLLRWWAKKASFTSRREGWSRAARLPRRSSGTAHRCNPDIYIPCLLITSCKKATTVNMIDTRIQITLQTLLPKLANVSVADSAALLAGGRRTGFPSLIWDLMARARMASATPSWQLSVARRIGLAEDSVKSKPHRSAGTPAESGRIRICQALRFHMRHIQIPIGSRKEFGMVLQRFRCALGCEQSEWCPWLAITSIIVGTSSAWTSAEQYIWTSARADHVWDCLLVESGSMSTTPFDSPWGHWQREGPPVLIRFDKSYTAGCSGDAVLGSIPKCMATAGLTSARSSVCAACLSENQPPPKKNRQPAPPPSDRRSWPRAFRPCHPALHIGDIRAKLISTPAGSGRKELGASNKGSLQFGLWLI